MDFIVLKKGGSIRAVSVKKFKERGFIPRISYECDNHYILKRMVEEGLGVAIWPEYSWRRKLEEEDDGSGICLKPLDIAEFTLIFIFDTAKRCEINGKYRRISLSLPLIILI